MGIRMTQYIGLPADAKVFVESEAKRVSARPCPHCGKNTEEVIDSWVAGGTTGMFEEAVPFHAWRLKTGRIVKEVEQQSFWSSGPMIFTMLVDENDHPVFKWDPAEIESYA